MDCGGVVGRPTSHDFFYSIFSLSVWLFHTSFLYTFGRSRLPSSVPPPLTGWFHPGTIAQRDAIISSICLCVFVWFSVWRTVSTESPKLPLVTLESFCHCVVFTPFRCLFLIVWINTDPVVSCSTYSSLFAWLYYYPFDCTISTLWCWWCWWWLCPCYCGKGKRW